MPSDIANTRTAPHYGWGNGCDGWRLLDGRDLTVIEEAMPPMSFETPHHHEKARQLFYVLAGHLRIEVDGRLHALGPSDALTVHPLERHQVRNDDPTEAVRFLVISAPSTAEDRIEALSGANLAPGCP